MQRNRTPRAPSASASARQAESVASVRLLQEARKEGKGRKEGRTDADADCRRWRKEPTKNTS